MLRAAAAVAPRSVSVCGNTATTAGLTVALVRDGGAGRDMSIEAGALVLADRGVCCIDELDKMTCDPHSLLEAMEQQSISVAKSGVVTTLKSRTTIIAAANPAGGCYDRRKSVSENLKLASALLSRFDLVFLMLDRPDEDRDRLIGEHIMRRSAHSGGRFHSTSGQLDVSRKSGEHASHEPLKQSDVNEGDPDTSGPRTLTHRIRYALDRLSDEVISTVDRELCLLHDDMNANPDIVRKYIEYSRRYCHPRLTAPAAKVLQKHYMTMRATSSDGYSAGPSCGDGTMPVTTRHLESLIRLSQARARLELREEVSEGDAIDVVDMLHESLLDAVTLDTGQIDFGRKGGMSTAKQVKALVHVLRKEGERRNSYIFSLKEISEFVQLLRLKNDVSSLVDIMRTECYLLLKGPRLYQLQCGT
mmetsp:Transcript_16885/g.25436  ORF Transcript_16885/g.25436 Transcript_16885/m.25436 type:complete len:417 (-) Transcript_16885:132-1382(-)